MQSSPVAALFAYATNPPRHKAVVGERERASFSRAWLMDRVGRIFAVDYKKLGLGLGYFSIALGLVEAAAPGRVARWLGLESGAARTVTRLFGARELLAGVALLRGPAVSTNVWNRVLGDGMDLAALGLAFGRGNRKAAAGALGFVAGAALVDVLTALGLDRETGRTLPPLERPAAS